LVCSKITDKATANYCSATNKCKGFTPDGLFRRPVGYGTEIPTAKLLIDLFVHINESGREVVLVGDSITRQFMMSIACELAREDPTTSVDPPVTKVMFDAVPYTVKLPGRGAAGEDVICTVTLISVWKPFGIRLHKSLRPPIRENSTAGNDGLRGIEEANKDFEGNIYNLSYPAVPQANNKAFHWMLTKIRKIQKRSTGVIMIFNVGLHEVQVAQNFEAKLDTLFTWAQGQGFLANKKRHNILMFRETNVQHFGNSPFGQYTSDMLVRWNSNFLKYAPSCDALNESLTEYKHFWRAAVEDSALHKADIRADGDIKRQIHRLTFRNISYALHDVKASSPLSGIRFERKFFDCTHFCGNMPLVWYTIFNQIDGILRRYPVSIDE
jgi:hypothetical protein